MVSRLVDFYCVLVFTTCLSLTEMSKRLADQFENKQIITHPGGHFFAAQSDLKPKYHAFFQDRLLEILEARELQESKNLAVDIGDQDVDQEEDEESD